MTESRSSAESGSLTESRSSAESGSVTGWHSLAERGPAGGSFINYFFHGDKLNQKYLCNLAHQLYFS